VICASTLSPGGDPDSFPVALCRTLYMGSMRHSSATGGVFAAIVLVLRTRRGRRARSIWKPHAGLGTSCSTSAVGAQRTAPAAWDSPSRRR
jgi:hypothetical protein